MQIVETPQALPGQCRVCGSATKEWYLDTGYSEEFVGAIYYCNECVAHIARVCGYMTPEDAEQFKARTEFAEATVYRLRIAIETTWKVLDELRLSSIALSDVDPSVRTDAPVLEAVEQGTGEASGGTDQLGEGTGASPEPSDDERVDELRSDAVGDRSDFSLNLG